MTAREACKQADELHARAEGLRVTANKAQVDNVAAEVLRHEAQRLSEQAHALENAPIWAKAVKIYSKDMCLQQVAEFLKVDQNHVYREFRKAGVTVTDTVDLLVLLALPGNDRPDDVVGS